MAPAVSTLPAAGAPQALRDSEKPIWLVIVPLSICIPCFIACTICFTRRLRSKKSVPASATQDVPIEVHCQEWLDHMRHMNQQNHNPVLLPDDPGTGKSLESIRLHDLTRHAPSQSTPPKASSHCEPPGSDSPMREEVHHNHSQKIPNKDTLELPYSQTQSSIRRRGSAQ